MRAVQWLWLVLYKDMYSLNPPPEVALLLHVQCFRLADRPLDHKLQATVYHATPKTLIGLPHWPPLIAGYPKSRHRSNLSALFLYIYFA